MKAIAHPSRINLLVSSMLDTLVEQEQPSPKLHAAREAPQVRQNRAERKEFFYYKQVINYDTQEVVGHMEDISSGGFKLDCQNPVPVNQDFRFLMNLTSEIADKPFMVFGARSRWCKVDPLDPYIYNVGYQLIRITPADLEIFKRMLEKYGREMGHNHIDLRRSNKW